MSNLPAEVDEYLKPDDSLIMEKLPSSVLTHIKAIPASIHEMSEDELVKQIKPDSTLERLRLAFWAEYDRACRTNSSMLMTNVYSGVVTKGFFDRTIANSFNLKYICLLPMDYELALHEATNFGLSRMREVLALSPIRADGKIDAKLIKEQREIWLAVQARVKGSVIQRVDINTKKQSVNVNMNATQSSAAQVPQTIEEINAQIAELEAGDVYDVTASREVHEEKD